MSETPDDLVLRIAARTVIATLLVAMISQFLAVSREDRASIWLTGSPCIRPAAPGR